MLKVLGCVTIMALASTTAAFAADSQDPNNPNCSPGVKGCTANYPTADVSKSNPLKNSAQDPSNPNCSPGVKGCTANAPTSDVTKKNPTK
jgi:hypothetical protein